jgi:GDPmannose 4,6-dehydratase
LPKTALLTGISGQDGAYLAALLLEKGYDVVGAARRTASGGLWRLRELGIEDRVSVVDLELAEYSNVEDVIARVQPDEVYNLGAQSFVGSSFEMPVFTSDVNALGVMRLLEAIRRRAPKARFYQASTSEMFGRVRKTPQDEDTPFYPRSPYGVAKVFGHSATVNYREAWSLFAVSGILFNHESPLRGSEFVTRKVAMAAARRAIQGDGVLQLGNLDAKRDWGFAGDFVRAMWSMLQLDEPEDFVVATGITHSVREFVTQAYAVAGFEIDWVGRDDSEKGVDHRSGHTLVAVSPALFRPAEVDVLIGDASKARSRLGFEVTIGFDELVAMMVTRDMEREAGRTPLPIG